MVLTNSRQYFRQNHTSRRHVIRRALLLGNVGIRSLNFGLYFGRKIFVDHELRVLFLIPRTPNVNGNRKNVVTDGK